MRIIKLTRGMITKVDNSDFDTLSQWSWFAHNRRGLFYAARSEHYIDKKTKRRRCKTISMHRQILGLIDPKILTDHANGDTLDNRKKNIRACDYVQNNSNASIRSDNTSKYKGISFDQSTGKWRAIMQHKNKNVHIGRFTSLNDAITAYNKKARELNGEFAKLNIAA